MKAFTLNPGVAEAHARREFSDVYRLTQARLRELVSTLPDPLRRALPKAWGGDELSARPHAPLMAEFFGVTDTDVIAEAFVAAILMEWHCCAQDARIDGHSSLKPAVGEALSNLLLAESLARFGALSGDARALAPYVQRAFADLAEGYGTEGQPEDFFRSVTNRAAPFHILIAALGLHAGQLERIEACSQMARHLLFWFQMLDDLSDWPDDLRHGRKTYLLRRLQTFMGDNPPAERDVEDALYLLGGAESLADEAIQHLEAALALASGPVLVRWIRGVITHHRGVRRWCVERKKQFLKAHYSMGTPDAAIAFQPPSSEMTSV